VTPKPTRTHARPILLALCEGLGLSLEQRAWVTQVWWPTLVRTAATGALATEQTHDDLEQFAASYLVFSAHERIDPRTLMELGERLGWHRQQLSELRQWLRVARGVKRVRRRSGAATQWVYLGATLSQFALELLGREST